MNCRSAKENFSSYIEQELSEIERRSVAAHLGRCPRCSSDLFAMQKAMSLLRWVPRVEGSPDFTRRLLDRIRTEEAREPAAAAGWMGTLVQDWREKFQELAAMLAAPAPVGALLAALVVGGGGGAFLVQTLDEPAVISPGPLAEGLASPGTQSRTATAQTTDPAEATPTQTPLVALLDTTPPAAATSVEASDPAGTSTPVVAKAEAATPAKASPRRRAPVRPPQSVPAPVPPREGVEVAAWANGGERLEGIPEGPPPISRVEYVLDRVDLNGRPMHAAPVNLQVKEGSVTF
jgi:hypothetical protein